MTALLFAIYVGLTVIRKRSSKHTQETMLRHAYYYGSVIGLGPVMLVGMSSVGNVGFYESILVLVFVVIGVFYIQKRL